MTDFSSTHWSQIHRGRSPLDSRYEQAWKYLLARYQSVIYWYFHKSAPNQDLADEWTDAFIAAWATGKLDGADSAKGRFRTYLYLSLKSFATDQFRKLNRSKTVGPEALRSLQDDRLEDPADLYEWEYAQVVLTRALERLKQFEELRQEEGSAVRWYSLLQDYYISPDSVAARPGHQLLGERYGLTSKAVERQLANARSQLRHWIEEDLSQTVNSQEELRLEFDLLIRRSDGLFCLISELDQC